MTIDDTVRSRLEADLVIWMTTVASDGPQSSPVWFLLDGDELLVYSLDSARVRNIAARPAVALNLNSNRYGGDVLTMEGVARVDDGAPAADQNETYVAKYRDRIAAAGWTPESFARDYPVPIRITITRVRAW